MAGRSERGPYRVVQVGLGPIGQQLTRYLSEREGVQLVGAVDVDPQLQGKDAGELAGIGRIDVLVRNSIAEAGGQAEAEIALVCTVSRAGQMVEQVESIAGQGLNILTTCEELTHPWKTHPEAARRIDELCKQYGVTCLATGVNPGFLMDYLPSVLTGICRNVESVSVERIQDAAIRRVPFLKKIGAGMTREGFEAVREGMGHVGLRESVYMIAEALGWELDEIQETLAPVIADRDHAVRGLTIPAGYLTGLRQEAVGYRQGKEVIRHLFVAAVGEAQPQDKIEIRGEPNLSSVIDGSVNGDIATSAIMINAIPKVCQAEPGLKTMLQIRPPSYF